MVDSGRLGSEGERSTKLRLDQTGSTSIDIFQRKESLAGFITDTVTLSDHEFLQQHPHPVLLTSMPDEMELAVWTVVLQIKKRVPSGASETALAQKAKDLYFESLSRPHRYYIGRGPECDVVLAPRSISRRHAILEFRDSKWLFADTGSTNGTKVNGQRLTPKTTIVLGPGASKLEFGADTLLWFLPPLAFLNYIKGLKRQVPDTPSEGIPLNNSMVIGSQVMGTTPREPIKLPPKLDVTRTSVRVTPEEIKAKIAEAETNTLIRADDESLLRSDATLHDDQLPTVKSARERSQTSPDRPAPKLDLELRQEAPGLDTQPRLREAIKALAAMDSLISSVTVMLRNNPQPVTLSMAEDGDTTSDVADQLITLGPKLKSVFVKLSVSETPVEIFSTSSSRLGRVSDTGT